MKSAASVRDHELPQTSLVIELMRENRINNVLVNELKLVNLAPEEVAQVLSNCCNPNHEWIVSEIESACVFEIENSEKERRIGMINALHSCALYYENIGMPNKALSSSRRNLDYAEKLDDSYIVRRAHTSLGWAYSRLCNYDKAFFHVHKAYEIALREHDAVATLMMLGNTVALMDSMGLLNDALRLSLTIPREHPWGSEKFDCLQLNNATNGMRISHKLNDTEAAEVFYQVAKRASKTKSRYLSDVNFAYYDAACIVQLALVGKHGDAIKLAANAMSAANEKCNKKITGIIGCAQAAVHVMSGDVEKTKHSQKMLGNLLKELGGLSEVYEEILCIMLRIDSFLQIQNAPIDLEQAQIHRKLLKVHLLGVKHQEFFARTPNVGSYTKSSGFAMENPFYKLPSWVTAITEGRNIDGDLVSTQGSSTKICEKRVPLDCFCLECDVNKAPRSQAAYAAENWAIAVECAMGGDGFNGLRVSKLAREIATELGLFRDAIDDFERACCLYNIGRISVAFGEQKNSSRRALGRFSAFSRHTVIGAKLLEMFDDDAAFKIGASIAATHHEWWNGCGYPTGLYKEEIPIEGRICAVADSLVELIFPSQGKMPWKMVEALNQLRTLLGVQFDPQIYDSLIKVVGRPSTEWWGCLNAH